MAPREDQNQTNEDRGEDGERRRAGRGQETGAACRRVRTVHASDPDDEPVEERSEEEEMRFGPPHAVREHEERDAPEEEAADGRNEDSLESVRAPDRDRRRSRGAL